MSLSGPPCRYAIARPSGLHAGRLSVSGSLSGPSNIVSWRGAALPPGAASITYRSQLLSRSASVRRLLTKTSDLPSGDQAGRSEEHTSELQSRLHLVCRLLLEKKKTTHDTY